MVLRGYPDTFCQLQWHCRVMALAHPLIGCLLETGGNVRHALQVIRLRWALKEWGAWGRGGTWTSGGHCASQGTAWSLSPALRGTEKQAYQCNEQKGKKGQKTFPKVTFISPWQVLRLSAVKLGWESLTDSTTSMGRCAVPEGIDVRLDLLQVCTEHRSLKCEVHICKGVSLSSNKKKTGHLHEGRNPCASITTHFSAIC